MKQQNGNQDVFKELNKLFKLQDGVSSYTVGEVRKKLINSGYPSDTVNKGIVDYLENQYIEE